MSAEKHSLVRKLKRELDELMLQLSLGKAEAADFIEEHKKHFGMLIEEVAVKVSEAGHAGEEAARVKAAEVRRRIDELKLQLALGRMESREAYEEQREQISRAIDMVRDALARMEEKLPDAVVEAKERFEVGAEGFKTKLDTLALNIGVGKVIAEEEIKARKDLLKGELEGLAKRLVDVADVAEEGARKVGRDVLETLSEIRKRF